MKPLSPWLRLLFAFTFTSVHWAIGRWRRALLLDAMALMLMLMSGRIGVWPLLLLECAQWVDALLLTPQRQRTTGGYVRVWLTVGLTLTAVASVNHAYGAQFFVVPTASMAPTLQIGDHFIVEHWARTPQRSDVVVFDGPKGPGQTYVKRVIAIAGDIVAMDDRGQVVLNGKPLPRVAQTEPCRYQQDTSDGKIEGVDCDGFIETLGEHRYPVAYDTGRPLRSELPQQIVPPGAVFVLGDNRDQSSDSRTYGPIALTALRGQARRIWWPLDRAGPLR